MAKKRVWRIYVDILEEDAPTLADRDRIFGYVCIAAPEEAFVWTAGVIEVEADDEPADDS